MARLTRLLLTACILICSPLMSEAGNVFTGFQIDNTSQYFIYLDVRTPDRAYSGGPDLFAQATTAGLGCSFKTERQL